MEVPSMQLKFQCHFGNCTRSFKRKDRLQVHMRTHTGDRPYICGVPGCFNSYTSLQHLSRHMDRVHFSDSRIESKVQCPHCGLLLANTDCLRRHEKRFHTDDGVGKTYKCPEEGCSEVFRKKQQLVSHREKDHSYNSLSAIRCHKCPHEGCDKSFLYPTVLRRHMKVHEGYECNMEGCGEVFNCWTKLRKHKAVDHGPELVCDTCQASFKTRQTLVQHLKTHNFVKEVFMCPKDGCERTFLYNKNLNQHIRAFHEGERVFKKKKKSKEERLTKSTLPKALRRKSSAGLLCGVDDRAKSSPETPLDLSTLKESDAGPSQVLNMLPQHLDSSFHSECDTNGSKTISIIAKHKIRSFEEDDSTLDTEPDISI